MTDGLARLRAFLEADPAGQDGPDAEVTAQLYRVLAENSGAFVTLADANGRLRWASPSVTHLLGWELSDEVGRPTVEFLHPDDIPTLIALRARMVEEESFVICCRVRATDGTYRWFDLAIKPVFDVDGALVARVTAYQDVQARVEAETALAASERQFRLLAENVSDVILHVRGTEVVWASPSLVDALGWVPGDWIGRDVLSFVHPDDVAAATPEQVQQSLQPTRLRLRLRGADDRFRWVESASRAHLDDDDRFDGWISSFRVIDDLVSTEVELDRRARFDDLTGLLNRAEALSEIARVTSHEPRTGRQTAVLFCDIDLFKDINDTHGHAAGDQVLRVMADRIRASLRKDDAAARIGGDELLVMLVGVHSLEEACQVAEKIRLAAMEPIDLDGTTVATTMSIGVTVARGEESTDDLVERADRAMYEAKRQGRNRVVPL